MLTDMACKSAKPGEKPRKIADAHGLYLQIQPTGGKLWRLKYRFDGKEKLLALGVYPDVSLTEARKLREVARENLRNNIDPAEQKRLDKLHRAVQAENTFKAIADEYIAKMTREGRAESTLAKTSWLLSFAFPLLGKRPINEILAIELLAVLRKVEARGRHETARRLRSTCGAIFRYAIATGRAERDVSADLRGALTVPVVTPRAAIVDPKGVGELQRAIDGYQGAPETRLALKLLALTFVRPGELRMAEWDEIDFKAKEWRIPEARTKMRRLHRVPLALQALAILEQLRPLTGRSKYLFPSVRSAHRNMSENTLNAALRRMGYGQDEMTAHGFRSIASSLLNESGLWNPDAIERALGHKDSDEIRRAYHRAEYWDERVKMAAWWADHLDGLAAKLDV